MTKANTNAEKAKFLVTTIVIVLVFAYISKIFKSVYDPFHSRPFELALILIFNLSNTSIFLLECRYKYKLRFSLLLLLFETTILCISILFEAVSMFSSSTSAFYSISIKLGSFALYTISVIGIPFLIVALLNFLYSENRENKSVEQ